MVATQRILLVDDEQAIADTLLPLLQRAGFDVAVAGDGEGCLKKAARLAPDLIILDVLMPRMNGRQALRELRRAGNWVPVIMLTKVGEPSERAMALEEGADDYINKPFDPLELVARVRAILRRVASGAPSLAAAQRLVSGELSLDRTLRRAYLGTTDLGLSPRAVQVLEYLMCHPDEVLGRERLLDSLWGWEYVAGLRAVDLRIHELRQALGEDPAHPRYIETVPGRGYRFLSVVTPGV